MLVPLTASETIEKARLAVRRGHGAGLPELLELTKTLSDKISTASISDLAEVIEKDAAVLTRVLQVANTIFHNPGIQPLTSLTHAIHQIGFTRIRSIAASLMLLDHAGQRNPPEQREAAARALCSGLLAQGCARVFGLVDDEFVFACNAVRHFGRILLPAVSIEHYRAAAQRAQSEPEAEAFHALFGITPIELSRELLADAHLPPEIARTLQDHDGSDADADPMRWEARLIRLIHFGDELATLALDAKFTAAEFVSRSHALAAAQSRLTPGLAEELPHAFAHADHTVVSFLRIAGVARLPTPSLQRLRTRTHQISETHPTPPAAATPTSPPGKPAQPFEIEPIDEARDAPDAWTVALRIASEAFHAQEVWVFELKSPEDAALVLTRGIGQHWAALGPVAVLRADDRNLFGMALTRHEAVVIHNIHDPGLRRHLPAWFLRRVDAPPSFVIFPLFHEHRVSGLTLIGWSRQRHVSLDREKLHLVRQELQQAQALDRQARGAPAPSTPTPVTG